MSESENINDLPFKLRFTSTEKLCKEITKLIHDRYEVYDKLCLEYETIGEHKQILGHIKSDLQTTHEALKELRSLCQCQSDDDKIAVNRQLANSEELLDKLESKFNAIATVKMCDISVKRLPSNWRAAMLKIARDKAKKVFDENVENFNENNAEKQDNNHENNHENNNENNNENNHEINSNNNEENKTDDNKETETQQNSAEISQKLEEAISTEAAEMNQQFEIDLERKIYETQVEELMSMVQMLIMRIKTIKARIDISKQLIKVAIKMKREYELSNSKLKEAMATCHCAEAGADDDQEFQKRMENKKRLEESVERLSNDLKYWEEQYSILKEGKNAKNNSNDCKEEVNSTPTTTIVHATQEEAMEQELLPIASTSSQQSCMFAGQSSQNSNTQQGTANPAVIYLEGLVAHQQPTYIPATNIQHPLGMYPHSYSIGHPHHPYHQAPDGSIQVYSSDIASHPGYIAYQ